MNKILGQIMCAESGINLCWTGNDGWLIGANDHLIAFDLDFCSEERNSPPPFSLDDLSETLDWLLITHSHGDHFNGRTCRFLAEHSRCRFILPESCRAYQREIRLPEERILFVTPGMELAPEPWLMVRTVRAIHGHKLHSIYENANLMDCGYFVGLNDLTVFQPGDSVLLQQHLEHSPVDVLMVSPTEHNTHIAGSVTMIKSILPHTVIAQHFGTYRETEDNSFWTHGFPDELQQALPPEFKGRYMIPIQGRIIHIVGSSI